MKAPCSFLIIAIIATISTLTGCDDRFKFLEDENTPPELSIAREYHSPEDPKLLTDGVKISLKHNNLPYSIKISATDKESTLSKVSYRFLTGNGRLLQGAHEQSGTINLVAGEAVVVFEPGDVGRSLIEFFVEDDFKRRVTAKADLTVFLNLPPVAKLKSEFVGVNGPYEYRLDARESIDQDQAQGGSIKIYHFIINGTYEITTEHPVIMHNFPGPGPDQREVKLEVIDNDGAKSELFTLVVR